MLQYQVTLTSQWFTVTKVAFLLTLPVHCGLVVLFSKTQAGLPPLSGKLPVIMAEGDEKANHDLSVKASEVQRCLYTHFIG